MRLELDTVLQSTDFLVPENPNRSNSVLNGDSSGILTWNDIAKELVYKRYKEALGNFWTPFEINLGSDVKQYKDLSEEDRERFRKVNALVAILDSVQPVWFNLMGQYITDSSIQHLLTILSQQEVVHNHSYSYVLSTLEEYKNQNKAFEIARTDEVVYFRNKLIFDVYRDFKKHPTVRNFIRGMIASMLLEGINFYSAFAYFYNLARNQKLVATSTMIAYINRDEQLHTKVAADILNFILEDQPHLQDYAKEFALEFFPQVVDKEIEWSEYILKGEEDIDMFEMKRYIQYRANKVLSLLNMKEIYKGIESNPMPWIRAFDEENANLGKSDFFEQKSRQYTKVDEDNGFDEL
ncbi:ribonucleotide-diphosphate reductase subunit beta [Cytobacillus gottheilii]|uniref:ribonucleotide-diphosphate reductase subunit beta n=1 Tax=Cytobacillus gottheilii TaxID=859144 RepID=UPI001593704F|nr:ribonucleotide-diphosphate reductase subunit beta [Cytobacillus gottheilii]